MLGFTALPATFLAVLVGMLLVYVLLIELGKRRFYRLESVGPSVARPRPPHERRIHLRASRWTTVGRPHRPHRRRRRHATA